MHTPRDRDSTIPFPRGPASSRPRGRRRQRGFTLIEAIISAGLLAFMALTATFFWVDGLSLVRTVNTDSAAVADGRATLERLAREIREVKYDTATGAYCVITMGATQMVFKKTNGTYAGGCGGAAPTTNEIVVTIQQGSTLNLSYTVIPAASSVSNALTAYANSFGLAYFKADGVTAATGGNDLRFVQLSLTLRPTGGQDTATRTVVALRNN